MEINAEFWVISKNRDLVKQAGDIVFAEEAGNQGNSYAVNIKNMPDWYYMSGHTGPTQDPNLDPCSTWKKTLCRCSDLLEENGIVIVRFSSPDAPDNYSSYAYTTPYDCIILEYIECYYCDDFLDSEMLDKAVRKVFPFVDDIIDPDDMSFVDDFFKDDDEE